MKKKLIDIYIYIYKINEKREFHFGIFQRKRGGRYLISSHLGDLYA